MNALIVFRANGIGSLTPTPAERKAAQKDIWANTQAALTGSLVPKSALKAAEEGGTAVRPVNQELGRDTFLQLLVSQMQHQDPLDPASNEDMVAQLAQFSALEQMNNLNDSFEQLSTAMNRQGLVAASNLLGRDVIGTDANGAAVQGAVNRVFMENGTVSVRVGDQIMPLENITEIGQTSRK